MVTCAHGVYAQVEQFGLQVQCFEHAHDRVELCSLSGLRTT